MAYFPSLNALAVYRQGLSCVTLLFNLSIPGRLLDARAEFTPDGPGESSSVINWVATFCLAWITFTRRVAAASSRRRDVRKSSGEFRRVREILDSINRGGRRLIFIA